MPYKDKEQAKHWHKLKMRATRLNSSDKSRFVTPVVTPDKVELDADGQVIYEE